MTPRHRGWTWAGCPGLLILLAAGLAEAQAATQALPVEGHVAQGNDRMPPRINTRALKELLSAEPGHR